MEQLKNEINHRLEEILNNLNDGVVKDAMKYSVMAPGKRLRPIIFLTVLKSYQLQYKKYIDIACAIEMIHTYSLIHDDLPGMDNDDLRRGRLTCHKKFDEATAILAGDALLNLGVNIIMEMDIEDSLKVKIVNRLYQASGYYGMIYGQMLDLKYENQDVNIEILKKIHYHKTGQLIAVCFQLASLIANPDDYDHWTQIGFDLGLAFQIQDDILDVIGDQEKLGKPVGSDESNHKSTYVSLLGIEKSQDEVTQLFQSCYENIYSMRINHGLILEILNIILKRVN